MGDELTTQPTLHTLLEMMRGMRDEMRGLREETRAGFEVVNERLEKVEIRLDRVESMALEARADLRDLKKQLREHLPALK